MAKKVVRKVGKKTDAAPKKKGSRPWPSCSFCTNESVIFRRVWEGDKQVGEVRVCGVHQDKLNPKKSAAKKKSESLAKPAKKVVKKKVKAKR